MNRFASFELLRTFSRFACCTISAAVTMAGLAGTPDQAACDVWQAACHYTVSSREVTYDINRVVIHKTQGATAAGAAGWFANCSSGGSAHYTLDKSNGYCYQSVRDKDVAWHAGYGSTNNNSIGIEHSGWVANNDTSTACYDRSAIETRSCVTYYGVSCSRNYIIGHSEVPGCGTPGGGGTSCHTDPGAYWNWSYYIAKCSPTPPPAGTTLRIGALAQSGTLSAKDGMGGVWITELTGVSAFQLEGNRIGALAGGVLYVKEGLTGTWTTMTSGVSSFQLCGNRIGALTTGGALLCKDGIGGVWSTQITGVSSFDLEGDRIAAVCSGTLFAKDGIGSTWSTLTSGIGSFQLCGNRIGALTTGGALLCKDGIGGVWSTQITGVSSFDLEGDRIAAVCSGALYAKDGIGSTWSTLTSGVSSVQLHGQRIGALTTGGALLCKDGIGGVWYTEITGASAFHLKGNRIGALSGGTVYVKEGMTGTWSTQIGNTITKFELQEY